MKLATPWKTNNGYDTATTISGAVLLENGFKLLLETGGNLLLETTKITRKSVVTWTKSSKNKTVWQGVAKEKTEWTE
jgi:hypothetical protein